MNEKEKIRFRSNVDIAIQTIIEKHGNISDGDLLSALYAQMLKEDALQIFVYLPIVFCRLLLPKLEFLDEYYEHRGKGGPNLRKFSENEAYQLVLECSNRYFLSKPGSENILKIAGRSGEFQAINELLNKGSKLEDLRMVRMSLML